MPQSDMTIWDTLVKYGWTVFLFLFGLQYRANRDLHGRVSNVKDDLAEHKLASTRGYATKEDHKDLLTEIRRGFERIENKLDGKADK